VNIYLGAEVRQTLTNIFSKILKQKIKVEENIFRAECSNWDSLRHVEIVFVVEDAFGIIFLPEDLEKLLSIDDFEKIVSSKLK
jgi:acyl carrier protein